MQRASGRRRRRSPSGWTGGPSCSSRPASALPPRCEEAHEFAAGGADFVLVGDFIWADPRGPKAALIEVDAAIKKAHAAALAEAGARLAPDMKLPRHNDPGHAACADGARGRAAPDHAAGGNAERRRPQKRSPSRRRPPRRRRPRRRQEAIGLAQAGRLAQAGAARDRDPRTAHRQSQCRSGVRRLSARPVQDRVRSRHRARRQRRPQGDDHARRALRQRAWASSATTPRPPNGTSAPPMPATARRCSRSRCCGSPAAAARSTRARR